MDVVIAILVFLGLLMQAALIGYLGYRYLRRPAPAVVDAPVAAVADPEVPTDAALLRHEHRPGPKDEHGIRHCRCGDRYLDGMRA